MNTSFRIGDPDRAPTVASARVSIDLDVPSGRLGGEVGVAVPAVTEPGSPLDRLRHTPADPPLRPFGRDRSDAGPADGVQLAVDGLAVQKGLDDQDALLKTGSPLRQIDSHGPELARAAAEAGLDDEGPRRHGGQRPDLLGHQHRMPQRDEKQAAGRVVGPLRQDATEHRYVLHVPRRTGGVVITQGQGVEASPGGGLCLTEHRRAAPPAGRSARPWRTWCQWICRRASPWSTPRGSVLLDRPTRPQGGEHRQAGR